MKTKIEYARVNHGHGDYTRMLAPSAEQWQCDRLRPARGGRGVRQRRAQFRLEIPNCLAGRCTGILRTVEQFEKQAREARELAEQIEER